MQLTFAGTVIATDFADGGFDAIDGFTLSRKPEVQWQEGLRATDAIPLPRFNRKRTLTGTIIRTYSSIGAARQAALLFLDSLPDGAALTVEEDAISTTFDNAVLSFEPPAVIGVTVTYKLSFDVGPGKDSTNPIETETGSPILTESGAPIMP